jgi:hypothetical protein
MKHLVNTQLFGGFIMPDELNEILDLDNCESFSESNLDRIYKSLETINDLVLIDQDYDSMQVIEGGFSFQCISYALKDIEELTANKPNFFVETVRLFKLNQYLNLEEILKNKKTQTAA